MVGYSALMVGRARESAAEFGAMARPFQTMVQYQWYADALHLLGEARAERSLGREMQRHFPEEFRGFLAEGRANAMRGNDDEALRIFEKGVGMRSGATTAGDLLIAGAEFDYHGYHDRARLLYSRAVEWYESLPAAGRTVEHKLGNIRALVAAGRGREAMDLARSIGRPQGNSPGALAALGMAAASAGDVALRDSVDLALERMNDLAPVELAPFQRVLGGSPSAGGNVSFTRAQIAAIAGDTARAASLLRRAFSEGFRRSWIGFHSVPEFARFRGLGPFAPLVKLID